MSTDIVQQLADLLSDLLPDTVLPNDSRTWTEEERAAYDDGAMLSFSEARAAARRVRLERAARAVLASGLVVPWPEHQAALRAQQETDDKLDHLTSDVLALAAQWDAERFPGGLRNPQRIEDARTLRALTQQEEHK